MSSRKTEQVQIRVTPAEKAAIRRRAQQAGLDVSAYVLLRAFPPSAIRWHELLGELRREGQQPRLALAALHDFVTSLRATELTATVADANLDGLSSHLQNYVAAMVEHTAYLRRVAPPVWVRDVEPLDEPQFEPPSASLRLHLLRVAPVPFKRRNLFVDLASGASEESIDEPASSVDAVPPDVDNEVDHPGKESPVASPPSRRGGAQLSRGPRSGSQPDVKFCPRCSKDELRSVASKNQPAETSHSYQCLGCGHRFEINEM